MSSNGGGWTLISRFSNADSANWMQSSGSWWYDRTSSYGSVISPSDNYDMISPAFWLVTGNYIKITRSDDSSNTALLYTDSCTGGKTFRSFITSFGNFRNGAVWNDDACRGSCYSYYGGNYSSTVGFGLAECSGNLQSRNHLSFWCDYGSNGGSIDGDGSVMMIGGGGGNGSCKYANHGLGITEADDARFGTGKRDGDFGHLGDMPDSYSLNLWIK